ncbi:hypothetical protein HU147_12460 [Planomicrobium chinense]|uniref:hypothetical protein n=1 Tax=Planococcus chinensis TaxID=272917 RepID=UPI001CC74280|nr:hypothetical protein [Planococcus chinensis]MBZ5202032.1 hypothetical protein [Planococcus chinensis]
MKIIEKSLIGKNPNQNFCEDGLFYNNHFVVVIDGATAKGSISWDGETSGGFARDIIVNYFQEVHPETGIEELLEEINRRVMVEINQRGLVDNKIEYPRASIIVYSQYYKQIWSYGDCQCLINGTHYTHHKIIDRLLGELRAFTIESQASSDEIDAVLSVKDIGREAILPFLVAQLRFENKDSAYGYPVINGDKPNLDLLSIYNVRSNNEVVFATDGYPYLFPTLSESEEALSRLLLVDPFCFKEYKSTKGTVVGNISFDDRAYIRFEI